MRLARSCCCSTAVCVVIFARLVQRIAYVYMHALLGQEVKSTRGESGRCLEKIDAVAPGVGELGTESPKRRSRRVWAGLVAGLGESRRAYCSPASAGCQKTQPLVGWPVTPLAAALGGGTCGGGF